jgi:carboxyl-terminal processing protease
MRKAFLATVGLYLLLTCPTFAQETRQPSRREILERDGIIWGSAAAWGVPFQENLSEDAKIAGLSRLWMEVKINFPHFAEISDVDWDKVYVDFIPKIRATTSTYEYYRVLQQMCALLKDGHSDVFLPKELTESMEADLPLRIDLIENRVFVTRVNSKELETAGVIAGLEILKINSMPVHEYVEKNRRPYVTSNSPQHVAVKLYSYGLLAGPLDRPVAVEFRSKKGHVFEKRLTRRPYTDQTTIPVFERRKLAGNIAYVRLSTFNSEEAQKELERQLPEIRESSGLILDIRENDGGSGVIAYNLVGYLTDKDFATTSWRSRQYVPTLRAWGRPGGWYQTKPPTWSGKPTEFYSKPVVVLIGPRCVSATDVFAETFQRLRRGKLIGEATGGSTGDPLAFALPGGGSARVSTSADAPDGLVGRGVQPDVLVPRTVRDFLAGHDAVLETGLSELRKMIQHQSGDAARRERGESNPTRDGVPQE